MQEKQRGLTITWFFSIMMMKQVSLQGKEQVQLCQMTMMNKQIVKQICMMEISMGLIAWDLVLLFQLRVKDL